MMSDSMDDDVSMDSGPTSQSEPSPEDPIEMSNYADEISGKKELLDQVADGFHVLLEDLPQGAPEIFWRFRINGNYDRFFQDLKALLKNRLLDNFLRQHPDIKSTMIDLFQDIFPYLKGLGTDKGKAPLRLVNNPSTNKNYVFGSELVEDDGGSETHQGHLKVAQTATTIFQDGNMQSSRPLRSTSMPYLTLTGSQDVFNVNNPPISRNQPIIQPQSSSTNPAFRFSGEYGSQRDSSSSKESSPDIEALNPLKKLVEHSNTVNEEQYEAWHSKFQEEDDTDEADGFDTFEDQNLHNYKGWKIEAPKIQLSYIIKFLCDKDIDRTHNWARKYAEIAEYLAYLAANYSGEDWGPDLHRAAQLLHCHWIFEQYHYGRRELIVDFPIQILKTSKRLPPIPGSSVILDTVTPDDMGERKLLLHKVQSVHEDHYDIPEADFVKLIKAYTSDFRELWIHRGGRPHPIRGNDPALNTEDRKFNTAEWESDHYYKCVRKEMRFTADMYTKSPFNTRPEDLAINTPSPSIDALKSFAEFRGAQRAAFQQCLNGLDNAENHLACSPWRALVLPLPSLPKKEPGIIFDCKEVENVPERAARDPFAYTLAHKSFVERDQHWADWARKHPIEEAYGELWLRDRKNPDMLLLPNYKGPIVHDFMDVEMKKVHLRLAHARTIHQRLKRAQLRAPRSLLTDVLHFVQSGLRNEDVKSSSLRFRVNELDASGEPVDLRPEEEEWLVYLGEDSINQTMVLDLDDPPPDLLFDVFSMRVDDILDDISPISLFRDTKFVSLADFIKELNLGIEGPVRRHRFTSGETVMYAELMEGYGNLRVDRDEMGNITIARPLSTHHPEDRILWFPSDDEDFDLEPENELYEDNDDMSVNFVSANANVSKLDNSTHCTVGMPKLENICGWDVCFDEAFKPALNKSRTHNLFCCLGYRLGKTIRHLKKMHEEGQEELTPELKQVNRNFLNTIVNDWHDAAERLPNNPDNNPDPMGQNRVTPSYRDIVHTAEPEAYKKEWGDLKLDHDPGSSRSEARQLLRKALVREAYENKSLIHPTRTFKVQDEDGKTIDVCKREPVWSFAHPDRAAKAPRFWDMNRWPVHLQTEETQAKIRASGKKHQQGVRPMTPVSSPQPPTPHSTPQTFPAAYTHQLPPEITQEVEIPYSDPDVERRRFKPGATEYWKGDTPLQQKRIENLAKQRFESRPKPPPFMGLFSRRQKPEENPTALPQVDPRYIPKSKDASPPSSATSNSAGDEEDEDVIMNEGDAEDGDEDAGAEKHGQNRFRSKFRNRPTLVRPTSMAKTQSAESRLALRFASSDEGE